MEQGQTIYEWSVTNKQKIDRDFFLGKSDDNNSRGIVLCIL
jgi:hypothetical protein